MEQGLGCRVLSLERFVVNEKCLPHELFPTSCSRDRVEPGPSLRTVLGTVTFPAPLRPSQCRFMKKVTVTRTSPATANVSLLSPYPLLAFSMLPNPLPSYSCISQTTSLVHRLIATTVELPGFLNLRFPLLALDSSFVDIPSLPASLAAKPSFLFPSPPISRLSSLIILTRS